MRKSRIFSPRGWGGGHIFGIFTMQIKETWFFKNKGGRGPSRPAHMIMYMSNTYRPHNWSSFELRELFIFITLLESTKQTESHGSSAFAQLLRNSIPFNSITRSLLSHSRGNYNSVPKIKPTRMPSHSIGRVNARFNGKFGLIDRRVTDLLVVWVIRSDLSPVRFFRPEDTDLELQNHLL